MKINEIMNKKSDVLEKDLIDLRRKLEEARFRVSTREEKNTRSIRTLKKDIARILTVLKQKEIEDLERNKPKAAESRKSNDQKNN